MRGATSLGPAGEESRHTTPRNKGRSAEQAPEKGEKGPVGGGAGDPFARLAPIYDRIFPQVVPKYEEALDLLVALIPYPQDAEIRVAELGCGTGEVLRRLAQAFPRAEIVGVDVSEAMLEVARTKLSPFAPRVRVLRHDLSDGWPQELGPCHAVVCPYVLEYLAPEAQRKLLEAAFSNLQPGGQLLTIEFLAAEEPRINQVFRSLEYRLISDAVAKRRVSEEELAVLTDLAEKGPRRYAVPWNHRLEMMRQVGFRRVSTAWQFLNFVLVVATRSTGAEE
ncbi:MAG: class I SAM-dependent methyltransferase [candidate division KSB1 bacterium]|nr:class I SAM-dependent methyltransferase [candidate division KSB1 bacterium]